MTALDEFYTKLGYHDWYYQYSDDHRVWRNGQANYDTLKMIAKESPEHQKLFEDFANYIFRDGDKPAKPEQYKYYSWKD